jgi:FMN-binding domain
MNRRTAHQVIPTLIMAGAALVPIATTAEILTHVASGGGTISLLPSSPIAMGPSRLSSGGVGKSGLSSVGGTRTQLGPVVQQPFGGVQASITFSGRKITGIAISAPQNSSQSASINQQAVPLLQRGTLQAQSAQVNTVSGATYTSQAYAQSLQAALSQARSQGIVPTGNPSSSQSGNGTTAGMAPAPPVSVSGEDA